MTAAVKGCIILSNRAMFLLLPLLLLLVLTLSITTSVSGWIIPLALRVRRFGSECTLSTMSGEYYTDEDDNDTISSSSIGTTTAITDWVIENLETEYDVNGNKKSITSRSTIQAGENDTLPRAGLCIGSVRILPSDASINIEGDIAYDIDNSSSSHNMTYYKPIRLFVGRNGWGTGVHPTTRLCIEWLCSNNIVQPGSVLLDYGCGSGILSITGLHLGASKVYGVDIEAEALVTAVRNVQNNGYNTDPQAQQFVPLHTREVLPYGIHVVGNDTNKNIGVDICIANILIGQLIRPSMVAALMSNIKPDGGIICFSGIRPGDQVTTIKRVYNEYGSTNGDDDDSSSSSIEWIMEDYKELAAIDTPYSIESYGFDCGSWCRLVGRRRRRVNRNKNIHDITENSAQQQRQDEIRSMSELAVS